MSQLTVRPAVPGDEETILGLIRGLAAYEHLEDQVTATPELLREWLFEKKTAEVLLAETGGRAAGYALFFHSFSTFLGKAGIYMEDLFVLPEFRGRGYGKALFKAVAAVTVERGCGRLEWACLDWNQPSIDFYSKAMHASPMEGWTTWRLTGDTLLQAAT